MDNTKKCSKCNERKKIGRFGSDRQKQDGLTSSCRDCRKKQAAKSRQSMTDEQRKHSAKWTQKWRAVNLDKTRRLGMLSKRKERLTELGQAKERAHGKIRRQLDNGKITKPTSCTLCDSAKHRIEFHHPDLTYQPENDLIGIWLCQLCHAAEHRRLRTVECDR